MENTIMTEKIARRGVATPVSFEPDVLGKLSVLDVMNKEAIILSAENPVNEVKAWLLAHNSTAHDFIVVDKKGDYMGTCKLGDLYNNGQLQKLGDIVRPSALMVAGNTSLRLAAELMAKHNAELVPVASAENNIIGSLSYKEIIAAYGLHNNEADKTSLSISLKRQRLKIMSKGRRLINKDSNA
jgi:Mg/Co/Ni transporter MgtE